MKKLVLFLCLGIFGCQFNTETEYKHSKNIENQSNISNISYYKDKRTGLCFAAQGLNWNYGVLTHVPCTPEVEKLIFTF